MAPKRRKTDQTANKVETLRDNAQLAELGEALRAKYGAVKAEPIPERLQKLIDAMRAAEQSEESDD